MSSSQKEPMIVRWKDNVVEIGAGRPVVIQSMTNTDTADVESSTKQVLELAQAGSELVRLTVNKEGETSDVIETDSALYIVRLDSETDKDATEKNRQNIIDKRKSDHYNEVLEGWQKKDGWKVNKKNVAKISFKNSLTQQDPNASTETQTSTETQNAESTQ